MILKNDSLKPVMEQIKIQSKMLNIFETLYFFKFLQNLKRCQNLDTLHFNVNQTNMCLWFLDIQDKEKVHNGKFSIF